MKKNILLALLLVLCWGATAFPQNVTTAGLELANTFQQINTFLAGIQLNGTNAGAVTLNASPTGAVYGLTFPATAPSPNQILTAGVVTGTLQWATPCGGFQAGGDLSGNSTSQTVVGFNGIAIDQTVTPQNGWVMKYNSTTGKWNPAAE
jgi:hypothetical protein